MFTKRFNNFYEAEGASGGSNGGDHKPEPSKELLDKITYLDGELKKVIKERDEAKSKNRETEEAEALKKGNYEKLIEDLKGEISTTKSELETVKVKATQFDEYEKRKRDSIKKDLGEKYKPSMDKLDISDLEELAETLKLPESKPHDAGDGKGGDGVKNPFKKETFNMSEQIRLKKENPELYEKYKKLANN